MRYGIHDMNRPAFGAQIYKYAGSHGCINTPLENAETIYKNVSVGTPVIVWGESGSIDQQAASQAKLEDQQNSIFA